MNGGKRERFPEGRQEERGRKEDNDPSRGAKARTDTGVYSDNRGDRDSDLMNSNRGGSGGNNDNYSNNNSNQYDGKRGAGNDGGTYDNYPRRVGRDDVYDRTGRSSGMEREGSRGRGKSNFINRSRSRDRISDRERDRERDRDRHSGNLSNSGLYNDRISTDNRNGSRAFGSQKSDTPSITVITLPFPASGGRFIYEHVDGRREYVDAVFSSSFGAADSRRRLDSRERDIDHSTDLHPYDDMSKDDRSRR